MFNLSETSTVIETSSYINNEDFTTLYLMVFKAEGVFKIGKANDAYVRAIQLQKHWGEVDYGASFTLRSTPRTVFKLETALHYLLSEYSIEYSCGDGKTEFFEMDGFEAAQEYLGIYAKRSSAPVVLAEGIDVPLEDTNTKRPYVRKWIDDVEFNKTPEKLSLDQQTGALKLRKAKYLYGIFKKVKLVDGVGLYKVRVSYFHKMLGSPASYQKDFGDLRNRVIQPCVKEINDKMDISVEWKPVSTGGRRIVEIEFTIKVKAPIEAVH